MTDIPIHDSRMFTYNKQRNMFVAEASDFTGRPIDKYGEFFIKSAKTGKLARFSYYEAPKDAEGEFIAYIYYNVYEQDMTVHILND